MVFSQHSLQQLLIRAYRIGPDQIVVPSWIRNQRYDIEATLSPTATQEQALQMLQKLLADRLRLELHHETQMLLAYELSVDARGLKMRKTQRPDAKPYQGGLPSAGPDGFPEIPEGFGGIVGLFSQGTHRRTFVAVPMDQLVTQLTFDFGESGAGGYIPAHIVNKSDLEGRFDFRLEYTVAEGFGAGPLGGGPELMEALEKQAGLKLQKTKLPMDVLVIDSVQREPTEN
jgi:uncharacterized protein (TIGR03435 family)